MKQLDEVTLITSMRKILVTLFMFFLLPGCSSQITKANEVLPQKPEPYTKMIEQLDAQDLEMAQRYADLVIKDFADSEYVYNAYLVKNIVTASRWTVEKIKYNYLVDGVYQMSSLNDQKDINQVKKYLLDIDNQMKDLATQFKTSCDYILNHSSKIDLKFPKAPQSLSNPSDRDFQALSWFSKVGTPVPTETEMVQNEKENDLKAFYYLTNGFLSAKEFSYIDYYYKVSDIPEDDDSFKKQLLNKVIELTENDKYNEYRLKAQDDLGKLN